MLFRSIIFVWLLGKSSEGFVPRRYVFPCLSGEVTLLYVVLVVFYFVKLAA